MLNGLFTDVLQSPGSCTLYIRLLCVLCVCMYVRMCVCSFVAGLLVCVAPLTHTHTTPTHSCTHTHVNTHRNSQSLPVLLWRRSRLSQKRRLRGEWLHCTELQAVYVITRTHTCARTHTHTPLTMLCSRNL